MSEFVSAVSIDQILQKLKTKEWQIPKFQREFVWSVEDVIALVLSILKARPIGMATIWEQPDDSGLELGPISIPDQKGNEAVRRAFSDSSVNPKKYFAVLDGLQRCTAIALAFGGFRSVHGGFKLSGRYFLDVATKDPLDQVKFVKEDQVKSLGYDSDAGCISKGLFPLSSNIPGETMLSQWMRYLQAIKDPMYYQDAQKPDAKELSRRDDLLKEAFEGINSTRLAIYIVPDKYKLSEICEIFETLNTTGTKVSTVDLIHSWLFDATKDDPAGSINLREWIDDLGQKDGALGWAASNDRPELIVQMVTACYIALTAPKPDPRRISKAGPAAITSVKAADLLATPVDHWRALATAQSPIPSFLGDFQRTVANGLFPWTSCPYPATAAIYVGLRYMAQVEPPENHPWSTDDLNAVFRAFFWRNALTSRYDQGFLTQLGTDLETIKEWLTTRNQYQTGSEWTKIVDEKLAKLIDKRLPTKEELVDYLTDRKPPGAIQKALLLPMVARAKFDLIDNKIKIGYPDDKAGVELHHIFPKAWCRTNVVGSLAQLLDPKTAGRDWANSISNLMPLSRKSNNSWKAKIPGQMLNEQTITYLSAHAVLNDAFINETCFAYLQHGPAKIKEFWEARASLIADDLLRRTAINV